MLCMISSDLTPNLTLKRWRLVEAQLIGQGKKGYASERAVAQVAGITIKELRAWVARSRLEDPEDDDWIHEIADVYDNRLKYQGETLEDVHLDHAINGVEETVFNGLGERVGTKIKWDHKLGVTMLQARDKKYQPVQKVTNNTLIIAASEKIRERILAGVRVDAAKRYQDAAIETDFVKREEEDD